MPVLAFPFAFNFEQIACLIPEWEALMHGVNPGSCEHALPRRVLCHFSAS